MALLLIVACIVTVSGGFAMLGLLVAASVLMPPPQAVAFSYDVRALETLQREVPRQSGSWAIQPQLWETRQGEHGVISSHSGTQ